MISRMDVAQQGIMATRFCIATQGLRCADIGSYLWRLAKMTVGGRYIARAVRIVAGESSLRTQDKKTLMSKSSNRVRRKTWTQN